ncbi:hypothetical protein, partial [Klebsiella pneumoniae]|uniref:hypothetical protein n=1 Tax=Klebsiella pneumoniae TaxID=573 RepID=UPI001953CB11
MIRDEMDCHGGRRDIHGRRTRRVGPERHLRVERQAEVNHFAFFTRNTTSTALDNASPGHM